MSELASESSAQRTLTIDAAPRRRPGRWAAAGVVVLLAVLLVWSALTNPRYQWDIVRDWFTARTIVTGLLVTLQLTAISMAIGIVLGIVLAVMRGSENRVLSSSAATFIWFFRGTPLLVQLIFWYNLSALYPHITSGSRSSPRTSSRSMPTRSSRR